MSLIAPSYVTVNPSYTEPGLILPQVQASGAFDTLPEGEPSVRLSEGDLYVYANRVDIRTKVGAGQSAYNQLPSVDIAVSQISTPTYLQRVRAEWDHHDLAAAARRGIALPQAQTLGMRQGHFQLARNGLLYGFQPQNGEGLLNTVGATAVNLPADSFGDTTVSTYDNGEMAMFLLGLIQQLKTRTNQLGIGREITILGPQRDLGLWEYPSIVQLTQYQRPGAGSTTTAGVVKAIMELNEDVITWVYDDTLIGKGAGGTDAIVIVMPRVVKVMGEVYNTNEFASLAPGLDLCTQMYADRAAPTEIPTPIPGGAIDVVSEWRLSPGWGIRPEAITILSAQFQ